MYESVPNVKSHDCMSVSARSKFPPSTARLAKGRTNVELREQFILADGVSQSMAAFKSKGPGGSSFGKGPGGLPTQGPITKVGISHSAP